MASTEPVGFKGVFVFVTVLVFTHCLRFPASDDHDGRRSPSHAHFKLVL